MLCQMANENIFLIPLSMQFLELWILSPCSKFVHKSLMESDKQDWWAGKLDGIWQTRLMTRQTGNCDLTSVMTGFVYDPYYKGTSGFVLRFFKMERFSYFLTSLKWVFNEWCPDWDEVSIAAMLPVDQMKATWCSMSITVSVKPNGSSFLVPWASGTSVISIVQPVVALEKQSTIFLPKK